MHFTRFILLVLSVTFLVFLPAPTANAQWQFCGSTGNFVANSTYDLNLQTLLKNLTTGATSSTSDFGFAKSIIGSVPNQVSGIVLCRGDLNLSVCSSRISQAIQDIQNLCAYNKDATVYYDDCLLRFSNQNFLSSFSNSYNQLILHNKNNVSMPFARFNNLADHLVNSTAYYAAFNDTKKFGTSLMNLTDPSPAIRGATQCTPDMSASTCLSCLQDLISRMPQYFNGRPGGRIVGVRCNFRYESYSFYEGAEMLTVAPLIDTTPAPAPAPVLTPDSTITSPAVMNSGPQVKKKTSTGAILAITTPLVLGFVAIAGLYICFLKRRKSAYTRPLTNASDTGEIKSVESLLFSLSALRVATINFAEENKLGEGGFGAVYKGVLPDGREIAVKRLSECSSQGLYELKNELLLLVKLQHKNLVKLLGVCLEGQEKMLIYEYVPNKSLDQILFDTEKQNLLDWERRYKIICGIARGLLYLHEDSQLRIIHRDLKASNILLDDQMNPKISDFGMARLFLEDQTQEVTRRVVGTFGYMAPEYPTRGHFSIKSDVFSYGVLVLEIVTGKKNSCTFADEGIEGLLSLVWKHWTDGTITVIADPLLGQHYPMSELLRCIQMALLCVQEDPADRPTMSNIALMLSSETVSLQAPSRPAFCITSGFNNIDGISSRSSGKSVPMSLNEVSITDIEAR